MPRKEAGIDKLINKAEAAERLSISVCTLDRMVADGELPMYKIRGSCRFSEADLEEYLEKCRLTGPAAVKPQPRRRKVSTDSHPCLYVPGMKVV